MSDATGREPEQPPTVLGDLLARSAPPAPWQEGDNIPWNEPGFSARMLREHLSQAHAAASRRAHTIDRHVAWIHGQLLAGRPTQVLDLGCGPGLYTSRLARLGHRCIGVDWSPASIAFAREGAAAEGLACEYRLGDLRSADYGGGYGMAMLIFGELNVFAPAHAGVILERARAALESSGVLLLEPHTFAAVQGLGSAPPTWHTAERGLFADWPHLMLVEHFWQADLSAATTRRYVVDLATGGVTRYAQSYQAYTAAEYTALLEMHGFDVVDTSPSLAGDVDPEQAGLFALVARKR